MAQKPAYPRRKVELVKGTVYAYLGYEAAHPQANIGVVNTSDGVIFIDCNTRHAHDLVNEMRAANRPIRFLIHTHSHWDHVTGNSLFSQAGAVIIASEACHRNMIEYGEDHYTSRVKLRSPDREVVPTLLPDLTFSERMTVHLGGEEIQLLFFGPAHTSDNIVVFLPQHGVLFTGDLLFYLNHCVLKQYSHPNPLHWPLVLDRLYQLPASVVVPGHGPLTNKEGLKLFQDYLVTFRQRVADLMAKGKTLEEIKGTIDLSEYASWRHQEMVPEDIEGMYLSLKGKA
ncbi:MAG: MBL fold metallo-hydrolase [Deltaproteobacteria bacterium]|nr:MBL fold metallo-hydrolase [Deltaproteobacteria bacterium]